MQILHTEASPGWGGQELRILREAEGMRAKGHTVTLCVQKGGGLVLPARDSGFDVYECDFKKSRSFFVVTQLLSLLRKLKIERLITHSSLDAWMGGIAARICRVRVVRTRHLSSSIRPGLNSYLLYNLLADRVVTTCAEIVPTIQKQAKLKQGRCLSIPTGVIPFEVEQEDILAFRDSYNIAQDDIVVGTLCVLRGWKGVCALIRAAHILKDEPKLKWLIVGSGPSEPYFRKLVDQLDLHDQVIFTGHLFPPSTALAAMDIFSLCSLAHEGVSQASLQAAWLKKPLVTTPTGGLKEVCLPNITGEIVPPDNHEQVARAIEKLLRSSDLRKRYGQNAHDLVSEKFMMDQTLDQMEKLLLTI